MDWGANRLRFRALALAAGLLAVHGAVAAYFWTQLRQPLARMIYVTSEPIHPSVVDYYLSLVPDVPQSLARRRLFTIAVGDSSARPLSGKLLERPRLIERIRSLIPDPRRAHLVPT